ncbi:unnamed protein product [Phytophthora lilii]|uniref:Unnamed protein product n=1 Tax=Phytophthora lilii TaxID=2077276 RepID=A0A9W6THK3_9STRA|nr:unnamed protein product [Phytophthora lilii]
MWTRAIKNVGSALLSGLLKSWHSTLKGLDIALTQKSDEESMRFDNYYEVLQVDDDYFPDEKVLRVEGETSKVAKMDRIKLFDEAFAEDMRLEVVYFLNDLGELVEGVFSIYKQVKNRNARWSRLPAVVAKVAINMAIALTAQLQLKYLSLQTAEDALTVIMQTAPTSWKYHVTQV